ncbi:MAG: hypothetical protein ACE5FQ_13545 [Thiogranum sp.]
MRCTPQTVFQQIDGLCQSAGQAAETVSLGLLRAIDDTVESLARARNMTKGLVKVTRALTQSIHTCDENTLDADEATCGQLEVAEAALSSTLHMLTYKRLYAVRDPKLNDHHEDAVVDAYDQTIEIISHLHDAIIDLRWAVMEHDADLESPTGEPVDNVSDLMTRLQA